MKSCPWGNKVGGAGAPRRDRLTFRSGPNGPGGEWKWSPADFHSRNLDAVKDYLVPQRIRMFRLCGMWIQASLWGRDENIGRFLLSLNFGRVEEFLE